jgi:Zn-dependent protease
VLKFKVGPFPVQVYPWFFISAVLLGSASGYGFDWTMLVWIAVVFISVLVHELGHAVVGRALGGRPEIRLEAFGGVTYPQLRQRPGPGRQFILSLAGPVAGLLLGAACYGLVRAAPPAPGSPVAWTMGQFIWVSAVWAIFNLLPILPLDGGQMMLAVVEAVRRKPSVALASWISVAVAIGVAVFRVLRFGPDIYFIAWCGFFAFQNFARARAAAAARPGAASGPGVDPSEQADVDQANDEVRIAVREGDLARAQAAIERLEAGGGDYRQAAALRLRAGIELSRGDNEAAALFAGQSFSLLQTPDAAVVAARANLRSGQQERARNWLRRAIEAGAPPAAVREDPELGILNA